jgi:hypothetical protein
MQESIPKERSQANVAKSFGIGPHKFVQIDENYFNGRGFIIHDMH